MINSIASAKSTAQQLIKTTSNAEVKMLAELMHYLADAMEETENRAKQAQAESRRYRSELKRQGREEASSP
jgi:hypothetical protein